MNSTKEIVFSLCWLSGCLACTTLQSGEIATFVEPYRDIDVAGAEMGTLAYLNIREGDYVTGGQVLAGLDESVLLAALQSARLSRDATGRLESAEAELQMQRERLAKIRELVSRGHASEEELARAEAQVRIAESQTLAVSEELAVKAAEFDRIQAQLQQKRIISPIDGIVTKIFKDVGEFVSASDPVVAKIVQLDKLLAEFSVPQKYLDQFSRDQLVTLEIGSGRRRVEGTIEFISPVTDAQSNTVRVRIRIENPDEQFHCGDSCWLNLNGRTDSSSGGRFVKSQQGSKTRRAD
jgi:RND family efflux transporter MFP subunit